MEEKLRVLLVDDERALTRLLKANLEQIGPYEVRAANSGAQALAVLRVFAADVVLLDVIMPDMTGFEVATRMQSDPELRDIRIIYLSAATSMDARRRVPEDAPWVSKPATAAQIAESIRSVSGCNGGASDPLGLPES